MKLSATLLLLLSQAATSRLATALNEPTANSNISKRRLGAKTAKNHKGEGNAYFRRTSNFFICSQQGSTCQSNDATSAEIVAATADGNTLVYSDAERGGVGRIDIGDINNPFGTGFYKLTGEPTSVAIHDDYVVVVENTSADYVNVSGALHVFRISNWQKLHTISLGGQPDSVAWSADGKYIVVAIENERDEDLGDGGLPQSPPGFVVVLDTKNNADPSKWLKTNVAITGLPGVRVPEDPEPEYVSINSKNIAVVTLQENNALVLIDLATKTVTKSFSAGQVTLTNVDVDEEGVIKQDATLTKLREPDGVAWADNYHFITANEGDWEGGSRGFTVFHKDGTVVFDSGSELEHIAAAVGHYPEERSKNKGNEPENVAVGMLDGKRVAFIVSERSSLIFVYDISDITNPTFVQVLPCGLGPEGATYIPSRGLLVAASEKDERDIGARGVVSIYDIGMGLAPAYPQMTSAYTRGGPKPIAWGASSGLSFGYNDATTLYSVEDSFYGRSRIFKMNAHGYPILIEQAIVIMDTNGVLEAAAPGFFVNGDKTVNLDPEGITMDKQGKFWIASEGKGSAGDGTAPNLLIQIGTTGIIEKVVALPPDIAAKKLKWGLEGVTFYDDGSEHGMLVACLQRPWTNETHPFILGWNITANDWAGYVRYPLDAVESPAGGWVGLSEIAAHDGWLYILERDNQGGPDARVKRIYKINPSGLVGNGQVVTKTLVYDILPILKAASQGLTPEKVEGMAVTDGGIVINNDNDGTDDYNGATYVSVLPLILAHDD